LGVPPCSTPNRMSGGMDRRSFIAAGVAALATRAEQSFAQQPEGRMPRVGILTPADNDKTPLFQAFKQGLYELGYIEGRNIVLAFRSDHGDVSLLPQLAAELVALPVDVIVTDASDAAVVAGKATKRIPIIMAAEPDPVSLGLAASLSRPGGNLTGFDLMGTGTELDAKQLDLLRTAFPNLTAVAVLFNPSTTGSSTYLQALEEAARSMGLRIVTRVDPGTPGGLAHARAKRLCRGDRGDGHCGCNVREPPPGHRRARQSRAPSGHLPRARICRRRRPDGLRPECAGQFSSSSGLC